MENLTFALISLAAPLLKIDHFTLLKFARKLKTNFTANKLTVCSQADMNGSSLQRSHYVQEFESESFTMKRRQMIIPSTLGRKNLETRQLLVILSILDL